MKFLLVIMACKYDDMTKRAVTSVIDSDYVGDIVLVTPDNVDAINGVTVVKTESMLPQDSMFHAGRLAMATDYDYIIYMHNDVVLPKSWFSKSVEILERVGDHVWCLSLPAVSESGRNYRPHVTSESDIVGTGAWYGIGRAPVFFCFCMIRYDYVADLMRDYGSDTYFISEYILMERAIRERQWCLFANIESVWHKFGYDTDKYGLSRQGNNETCVEAHIMWFEKFGYNFMHLIEIWTSYILSRERDIITRAANAGRWEDIDYLFDVALELLDRRDCKDCPVVYDGTSWGCFFPGIINQPTIVGEDLKY